MRRTDIKLSQTKASIIVFEFFLFFKALSSMRFCVVEPEGTFPTASGFFLLEAEGEDHPRNGSVLSQGSHLRKSISRHFPLFVTVLSHPPLPSD